MEDEVRQNLKKVPNSLKENLTSVIQPSRKSIPESSLVNPALLKKDRSDSKLLKKN